MLGSRMIATMSHPRPRPPILPRLPRRVRTRRHWQRRARDPMPLSATHDGPAVAAKCAVACTPSRQPEQQRKHTRPDLPRNERAVTTTRDSSTGRACGTGSLHRRPRAFSHPLPRPVSLVACAAVTGPRTWAGQPLAVASGRAAELPHGTTTAPARGASPARRDLVAALGCNVPTRPWPVGSPLWLQVSQRGI